MGSCTFTRQPEGTSTISVTLSCTPAQLHSSACFTFLQCLSVSSTFVLYRSSCSLISLHFPSKALKVILILPHSVFGTSVFVFHSFELVDQCFCTVALFRLDTNARSILVTAHSHLNYPCQKQWLPGIRGTQEPQRRARSGAPTCSHPSRMNSANNVSA